MRWRGKIALGALLFLSSFLSVQIAFGNDGAGLLTGTAQNVSGLVLSGAASFTGATYDVFGCVANGIQSQPLLSGKYSILGDCAALMASVLPVTPAVTTTTSTSTTTFTTTSTVISSTTYTVVTSTTVVSNSTYLVTQFEGGGSGGTKYNVIDGVTTTYFQNGTATQSSTFVSAPSSSSDEGIAVIGVIGFLIVVGVLSTRKPK